MIRPWLLRPALEGRGAKRDFSGRLRVISEKSETVWKRRPGEVGLRFITAICYTPNKSMDWSSASLTKARLVSLRLPMVRRVRLRFPRLL